MELDYANSDGTTPAEGYADAEEDDGPEYRAAMQTYAERRKTDPLPLRLSELLTLAVADARALPKERYQADAARWHTVEGEGGCRVCLAGAVLASRVGQAEVTIRQDALDTFSDFDALMAIDLARCGMWAEAWEAAWRHAMGRLQIEEEGLSEEAARTKLGETARTWKVDAERGRLSAAQQEKLAGLEEWPEPRHSEFTTHAGLEAVCRDLEAAVPKLQELENDIYGAGTENAA